MPQILKTIDQIAREKQRDVLFVTFHNMNFNIFEDHFDYEQCQERDVFIQWLGENNIKFKLCFGFYGTGYLFMPYLGQIYLDVPYDESNSQYQMICRYLENPDGSLKVESVKWFILPLKLAIKNLPDDDPEFDEKSLDDF